MLLLLLLALQCWAAGHVLMARIGTSSGSSTAMAGSRRLGGIQLRRTLAA